MKYNIIADSSCDLSNEYINDKNISLKVIPFILNVGKEEFIDDKDINLTELMEKVEKNKSSTACPSPETYYEAMDADINFVVTISSSLSGSYNSACVARNKAVLEGKKVCVVDSKATSGIPKLIIDRIVTLIKEGESFEDISKNILAFTEEKKLLFMLRSFDNLIRNGRMSAFAGKIASALNITPICEKTAEGTIDVKEKIIGTKKTIKRLLQMVTEALGGKKGEELVITHCEAEEEAKSLMEKIKELDLFKKITIIKTKGLTSYYAQKKGVLLSF